MEGISTRLKKAMSARNISQADLAEKTKISKGALSSYISGRYIPKQNNIFLLAKALDVSEDWLMGSDVPMEASLINIIEKRLSETKMTLEDISNETGVSLYWLQHIDTFIPGELGNYEIGYEWITRVASVLGLPGSVLRTALARQEVPIPDDLPQVTAKEVFGRTSTYKAQNKNEFESLLISEQNHIKKYRFISTHMPEGATMVDMVLDKTYNIAIQVKKQGDHIKELETTIPQKLAPDERHLLLNAAHERTDCESTSGGQIHDNEIMEDDTEWE